MALPSERSSKQKIKNRSGMDEIEVGLRRFGDERSTLLDQFERLSFEVQLNQAILRRSLSEPATVSKSKCLAPPARQPSVAPAMRPLMKGRRGSGFCKVLKKLIKPFFLGGLRGSHNNGGGRKLKEGPNPMYHMAFSKSLRL